MKFLTPIVIAISALLLLNGCITCGILIESALMLGDSKKDISDDPRCKSLIGKEFVLTDDAYLYRWQDSNDLQLNRVELEDDRAIMSFCELVKKGTVIQVKQVLIETSFGNELCSQHILVQYLRNNNKLVTADCSYMFKQTFFHPEEPWNFEPISNMLIEANDQL